MLEIEDQAEIPATNASYIRQDNAEGRPAKVDRNLVQSATTRLTVPARYLPTMWQICQVQIVCRDTRS